MSTKKVKEMKIHTNIKNAPIIKCLAAGFVAPEPALSRKLGEASGARSGSSKRPQPSIASGEKGHCSCVAVVSNGP